MLNLTGVVLKLILSLCELVKAHSFVMESGVVWRILQLCFYNLSEDFLGLFPGCHFILADAS
jgi:hypothetical protein